MTSPGSPAVVNVALQSLKISQGVDERSRSETGPWQERLLTCENYVVNQDGALTRRNGTSQLAGVDDAGVNYLPSYRLLTGRANTPIVYGSMGQLYDWSEKKLALVNKGNSSEFGVTLTDVGANDYFSPVAPTDGPFIATKEDNGRVLASGICTAYSFTIYEGSALGTVNIGPALIIVDRLTGQTVRRYFLPLDALVGATTIPYAVAATMVDDRYLHLAYARNIGVTVGPSVAVIDTAALPADLSALVYTVAGTLTTITDICITSVPSYSVVGYHNGTNGQVVRVDNSGTPSGPTTMANYTVTGADTDGVDLLVLSGVNVTTTKHQIKKLTVSGMAVTATVTSTLAILGTKPRIACNTAGDMRLTSNVATVSTIGTISVPTCHVYQVLAADTDFTYKGSLPCWTEAAHPFCDRMLTQRFYACMVKASASSLLGVISAESVGSLAIVDITTPRPTMLSGTVARWRCAAIPDIYTTLNVCSDPTSGVRTRMLPRVGQPSEATIYGFSYEKRSGDTSRGYVSAELRMVDPSSVSMASDVISGGMVSYYDGGGVAECGFVDRPSLFTKDSAVGTGPGAGTYSYVAIYEYCGTDGKAHYSRCSPVSTLTLAGATAPTIQVSSPAVTAKMASGYVNVRIYRTTNGGSQYFFHSTAPQISALGDSFYQTISDGITDTVLLTRPPLYRQPGSVNTQLDRFPGVACKQVARHKDRVFFASGSSVYYSSFAVDGEAPWFNPAFVIPIPDTGPVTGLASQDGTLLVFKENNVYAVQGDGPPENGGTGAEFSPPERISADYGCIDARSLVSTPLGTMFRSRRGLELLTKKLQVNWIGERVRTTVDANAYTLGSCHNRTDSRVFWVLCNSVDTYGQVYVGPGVTICYDLSSDCFTTIKHYITDQDVSVGVQDTVYAYCQGRWCNVWVNLFYAYYEPGPTVKTDGPSGFFPKSVVESMWIKAAPQDRAKLSDFMYLGQKLSNHAVKISVAFNFIESYTQTKTWQPNEFNTLEELDMQPAYPNAQAWKFKVEQIAPTNTGTFPIGDGTGADVLDIAVKIGVKGGGVKLPTAGKG